MKKVSTLLLAVLALVGLYAAGYWLFIKRDLVSSLPTKTDDPFEVDGMQGLVKDLFDPVEELDTRINHDGPIRERLIGTWRIDGKRDFVSITSDLKCEFRLGEFSYRGPIDYSRSYTGLFTTFQNEGKTHIFIFSSVDGTNWQGISDNEAKAYIGHDPEPLVRENDYFIVLTKQAEQDSGGDP